MESWNLKTIMKNTNLLFYSFFLFLFLSYSPFIVSGVQAQKTNADSLKSAKRNVRQAKNNKSGDDDYYKKNFFRYEDCTYDDNIKTILLYKEGFQLAPPLIQLGSDEKIHLSFDDLSGNLRTFKYTIIHCDANWKPSDLMPMQYIDGFTEDDISTFGSSFNTDQKYYHYDLVFPTQNLKPLLSGNYILKVYKDEDKDENLMFSKRFMIVESKVEVTGIIRKATSNAEMNYKQEVDFTIAYSSYPIINPYSDLKIVVTQNDRWDNANTSLQPKYIKDNLLDYNYTDDQNTFNGGNEYRHFDIKSLKFVSDRLQKITTDSLGFEVYLQPDPKRSFTTYNTINDINGKKLIKTDDPVRSSDLEGEYVYVHFFLPTYDEITDGNLYIFGALTDWHCQKDAIMKFDSKQGGYTGTLYLKQGYYNYEYILLKNNATVGDETFIEGNHFETENDYSIYVYNQEQGTNYDKLVAVKRLNSIKN
jgi:hypothetical protein